MHETLDSSPAPPKQKINLKWIILTKCKAEDIQFPHENIVDDSWGRRECNVKNKLAIDQWLRGYCTDPSMG
jgi:hypothetical protein